MSERDGGPAFPWSSGDSSDRSQGMSLRDYFAGQALADRLHPAYSRETLTLEGTVAEIARIAYLLADAMLKERTR